MDSFVEFMHTDNFMFILLALVLILLVAFIITIIKLSKLGKNYKNEYNKLISGYVYTVLLQASYFKYNEFVRKVKVLKKYTSKVKTNDVVKMRVIISIYNYNHLFVLFVLLKIKKVLVK